MLNDKTLLFFTRSAKPVEAEIQAAAELSAKHLCLVKWRYLPSAVSPGQNCEKADFVAGINVPDIYEESDKVEVLDVQIDYDDPETATSVPADDE